MNRLLATLALLAPLAAETLAAEPPAAEPLAAEQGASAPPASESPASVVRPGMRTTLALDLLGVQPDHTAEIGAACGVLEVSTWEDRGLRLISVDGVVSAVSTH